jgi:class 3 adenylate cyclase/tetratricopeptide (TPR) repeat protein/ribosomal protein L40E
MLCPQCQTENPAKAKFCLNCGSKLATLCPQCGAELPPAAKFCLECGAQVGAAQPTMSAVPSVADGMVERMSRLVPQAFAQQLLATQGQVEHERRLVTILFSDVKGSTKMAETLDPEEVLEIMNGAFDALIEPIYRHEGTLARLMGDAILAFFGAPIAHENDPERAVRAALEIIQGIQDYAIRLEQERGIVGFNVRVGINTGPVVVGEVGSDLRVEYTAMGDAINLAARMEQNAPVGGVLISHHTYQHVRGLFEVQVLEPIAVKGKAEPVQVYEVVRARPRAFRMPTRGVEGVETRMVGREAELMTLQDLFRDALEDAQTRMLTLVGDAGIGKSRLLYEFENWLGQQPEALVYFKGRATPELQNVPYGLLRDMFTSRFELRESDDATTVLAKFRAGMADYLPTDRADLVGQLVGFDFKAAGSEAVSKLLGSESFSQLALAYLLSYFRAVMVSSPAVIFCEDVHWADDSTLDALDRLVTEIPHARLLVVCLARPPLFERRPNWGEGREAYTRLDLRPLSRRNSRTLVAELLQKVSDLPAELEEMVVTGAEGNPYYLEELIKMLIENGVIVCSEQAWTIEPARLATLQVPSTLTGVLQARLDSLPQAEKDVLQRASVVGREFWDVVVAQLAELSPDSMEAHLDTLRDRAMIFRREHSAFAEAREYIFKHTTLRDVTYETVLLKKRRAYHAQVAAWLEANAGQRIGEYLSLIAHHYTLGGETAKAVEYLRRAGEESYEMGARREAAEIFRQALTMTPENDLAGRAVLLTKMGTAILYVGDKSEASQCLNQGLAMARQVGNWQAEVEALNGLAVSGFANDDYDQVKEYAGQALALARQHEYWKGMAEALEYLGVVNVISSGKADQGFQYLDECMASYAKAGDLSGVIAILRLKANYYQRLGQYEQARQYTAQAMEIVDQIGDQRARAITLYSLAEIATVQDRVQEAEQYLGESQAISQEIGYQVGVVDALEALSYVNRLQGKYRQAEHYLEQARVILQTLGVPAYIADNLKSLGEVARLQGKYAEAKRYLEESMAIYRQIDVRWDMADCLGHLGHLYTDMGETEAAWECFREALHVISAINNMVAAGRILTQVLVWLARTEKYERATELIGLLKDDPTIMAKGILPERIEPAMAIVRQHVPADQIEAALARGRTLKLDKVVEEILAEQG